MLTGISGGLKNVHQPVTKTLPFYISIVQLYQNAVTNIQLYFEHRSFDITMLYSTSNALHS